MLKGPGENTVILYETDCVQQVITNKLVCNDSLNNCLLTLYTSQLAILNESIVGVIHCKTLCPLSVVPCHTMTSFK